MPSESNDKRITILTAAEIKELYSLPKFTAIERKNAFYLTEESEAIVNSFRQLETKAYYILLQGYFREKPILFTFHFRCVMHVSVCPSSRLLALPKRQQHDCFHIKPRGRH